MSKKYTKEEVAKHNNANDLWIILGDSETGLRVYDVTKYHKGHPGGANILIQNGGTNAQAIFLAADHSDIAINKMKGLLIGTISDEVAEENPSEAENVKQGAKTCTMM